MLQIRLFGVLTIERDGKALPLPASAQARGLIRRLRGNLWKPGHYSLLRFRD